MPQQPPHHQASIEERLDQIVEDLARTPIDDHPMSNALRDNTSSLSTSISNSSPMDIYHSPQTAVETEADTPTAEAAGRAVVSAVAIDETESTTAQNQQTVTENAQGPPIPSEKSKPLNDQGLTDDQVALRKQILAVQQDASLSMTEKARRMQQLMTKRFSTSAGSSDATKNTTSIGAVMAPVLGEVSGTGVDAGAAMMQVDQKNVECVEVKHVDGSECFVPKSAAEPCFNADGQMGCKHYQRACKVKAACCGEFYVCRFCHDESQAHKMNRNATQLMLCMHCSTVQPPAKSCAECHVELAKYYCEVCRLWDNHPEKSIYHCDKCGICRLGKGLDQDYFHCDKCNVCLSISLRDNHRCIERNLESDCPICGDYMFESTEPVIFMPCAHGIHWSCYQDHIKNSYQCPICWKSLADMSHYFSQIDRMLEQHKMPPEYADFYSYILCNDCEKKSKTKYHFLYHKCQECGSYNTKIVSTVQERAGGDVNGDTPGTSELLSPDATGNLRPRATSALSSASSSRGMAPDDNDSHRYNRSP